MFGKENLTLACSR